MVARVHQSRSASIALALGRMWSSIAEIGPFVAHRVHLQQIGAHDVDAGADRHHLQLDGDGAQVLGGAGRRRWSRRPTTAAGLWTHSLYAWSRAFFSAPVIERLYSAVTKMKPSKDASFSCQATACAVLARGPEVRAPLVEERQVEVAEVDELDLPVVRCRASSKIQLAGLSANRVSRVEPMMTAMRGFVVTPGLL